MEEKADYQVEVKPTGWLAKLDGRQRSEVELARLYARDFAHGTAGHHRLMLIAKLAELLDEYERVNDGIRAELDDLLDSSQDRPSYLKAELDSLLDEYKINQ